MGGDEFRTAAGNAAANLVLGVLRVNGLLVAAGERLAAADGLTAARWQVLGAIALARRSMTVPQIARRIGLTRQSVQVSVNRLVDEALIEAEDNRDHRRSPLFRLTELGAVSYARVDQRQVEWINELADGLTVSELQIAAHALQELGDRLSPTAPPTKESSDRHEVP